MTELKTLKDLHFGLSDSKAKKLFKEEFIIKELKQEAIKWVKHVKKNHPHKIDAMQPFKEFFNLTEADLK